MPLSLATATTFVNLCIGVSALASAQGWGLDEVKRALGCLKDASTLRETITHLGLGDTAARLRNAAQTRVAALEANPEFAATAQDCLSIFEQGLPHCTLDPANLVHQRTAAGITDHWRRHIADTAPRNLADYFADAQIPQARFFTEVATPVIDALLRDPAFQPALEYDRWDQALGMLTDIRDLVRDLRETKETTVHQDTLFALARKIRPSVRTKDDALRELEAATDLAAEAIARGEQGSNVDSFVNEVLHRLAQLTEAGELDTAAQTAQAELQRAKAGLAQLRDQAIRQHLLNQDAPAAAALIVDRVVENAGGDPVEALRREQGRRFVRGRDKGVALDLKVAIALSQASLPFARNKDEKGAVLNNLGIALQTLGKRETGTNRLEQAVAAYERALMEWTRERVPLDWAATQNNLGNVLRTLGERETGTEQLERAIDAYRAALQVYTYEQVPRDWAMVQNNLGFTLATIGTRQCNTTQLEKAVEAYQSALQVFTGQTEPLEWALVQNNLGIALTSIGESARDIERLEQAISAFDAALQIQTRETVPLEWSGTQSNLGAALQISGAISGNTVRLRQAIEAFQATLQVQTREVVPLPWAFTQGNLANLHIAMFEQTYDASHLDRAQEALDNAVEVFTEARAAQYLGMAEEQQAQVDALRP